MIRLSLPKVPHSALLSVPGLNTHLWVHWFLPGGKITSLEQGGACGAVRTYFWPAGSLSGYLPSSTLCLIVPTRKADSGICEKFGCSSLQKQWRLLWRTGGKRAARCSPQSDTCYPTAPHTHTAQPPPDQNCCSCLPPPCPHPGTSGSNLLQMLWPHFYGQSPQLSFLNQASLHFRVQSLFVPFLGTSRYLFS